MQFMDEPKKTYREINGTTRVGDFLRSIGKGEILEKILGAGAEIITGDVSGALREIFRSSDELTQAQREYALKLLESDVKEGVEISNRWKYDMESDSYLSKNIRPLMLMFLSVSMVVFMFLDSSLIGFKVVESWIQLLETLLITAFVAYFGGRSFEKTRRK